MDSDADSQNEPSSQSQTGDLNISARGDVPVGGDVSGRDKYSSVFHITVQKGAQLILADLEKLHAPLPAQGESSNFLKKKRREASSRPKLQYRRKLVYALKLDGDPQRILEGLSKWRIVYAFEKQPPDNHPGAAVSNGNIGIGHNDAVTFNNPPTPEMYNCSVECELQINEGSDSSFWAGIRVRGFLDDIRYGYLAYLRRNGEVELYRAGQIIGGERETVVPDTNDKWTRLRVDILNSRIKVWVNQDFRKVGL